MCPVRMQWNTYSFASNWESARTSFLSSDRVLPRNPHLCTSLEVARRPGTMSRAAYIVESVLRLKAFGPSEAAGNRIFQQDSAMFKPSPTVAKKTTSFSTQAAHEAEVMGLGDSEYSALGTQRDERCQRQRFLKDVWRLWDRDPASNHIFWLLFGSPQWLENHRSGLKQTESKSKISSPNPCWKWTHNQQNSTLNLNCLRRVKCWHGHWSHDVKWD